jgi:hypothetical protein
MVADRSATPPPRRRTGGELHVIEELESLRDSPRGRLRVRILEGDRGRRLDVREYVTEQNYEGFTKRGIHLSNEEADALFAQRETILKLLEGGRR